MGSDVIRPELAEIAARLLRYVAAGGPVSYTRSNRLDGTKRVVWEVDADRFDELE